MLGPLWSTVGMSGRASHRVGSGQWGSDGVGRARAGDHEDSQQLYPELCVETGILAPLGLWGTGQVVSEQTPSM